MREHYEFPEELRLITDEPIEDDGWGEFRTEWEKVSIVIHNMAEFVVYFRCLLHPTFDLDKHIAALIKKRYCPFGKVINVNDQYKMKEQLLVAQVKREHITEEQKDLRLSELKQLLETRDKHEQRTCNPCDEAGAELQRDGYSQCGIFVTEQYLRQTKYADCVVDSKEKTKVLLKRYKELGW